MHNCECKIAYDYDPVQGDSPELRSNHRHISKCQYHTDIEEKELHDTLCVEQSQVAIVHIKIAEIHPELIKGDALDESKVSIALDENRDVVCVVQGLDAQKLSNLETTLKGVCDRDVKVI